MINNFYLVRSIFSGVWFIDKTFAQGMSPFIAQLLRNELPATPQKIKSGIRIFTENEEDLSIKDSEISSVDISAVAIIPITGPILKYDTWCEYGMQTRAKQLTEATKNPNIRGTVLLFDTPGGESMATEIMHDCIQECKAVKPVIGVANGLMCSAGMWIGSACDEILVDGESSVLGSIGTMMSFADTRGWKAFEGIKFHEIYATKSKDKNKDFRDARDYNYETARQEILDPLNELFLAAMKTNRPGISENALTGKVFIGSKAIEAGLADRKGNLLTAINTIMFGSKKYGKLDQFSGKKSLTAKEKAEAKKVLTELGLGSLLESEKQETNKQKKKAKQQEVVLTTSEGQEILVFADSEDLTDCSCVLAEEGEATEELVPEGEHQLDDGRILAIVHENDTSYVESLTQADEEEEEEDLDEEDKKINAIINKAAKKLSSAVDMKLNKFKRELSAGKVPPSAQAGKTSNHVKESAFERRKKEIKNKTSNGTKVL